MRNGSTGAWPPRFVALRRLPTNTSATTPASASRSISRYRLVKWGNRRSPVRAHSTGRSWQRNGFKATGHVRLSKDKSHRLANRDIGPLQSELGDSGAHGHNIAGLDRQHGAGS